MYNVSMTTFMEKPQKSNSNGLDFLAKMSNKNKQQNALAQQAERLMLGSGEDEQSATARRNGSKLAYSATGNFVVRNNGRVEVAPTDHVVSEHIDKKEKSIQALNPEAEKFDDLTPAQRARLMSEDYLIPGEDPDYEEDDAGEEVDDYATVHANKRRRDRQSEMRTVELDAAYGEDDDFGDYEDGTHLDTTMVEGKLKPEIGLRDNPKDVDYDNTVTVSRKNQ